MLKKTDYSESNLNLFTSTKSASLWKPSLIGSVFGSYGDPGRSTVTGTELSPAVLISFISISYYWSDFSNKLVIWTRLSSAESRTRAPSDSYSAGIVTTEPNLSTGRVASTMNESPYDYYSLSSCSRLMEATTVSSIS